MIEANTLVLSFTPLILFACAVAMIVLRAGASRVFFDVVGTFQASRLIKDAESAATVLEALYLDAFSGIHEAGQDLGQIFTDLAEDVVPISREIEEARIQFDKFLQEADRTPEVFADIANIGTAFGFSADQAFEASARMAQLSGTLGSGTTGVGTELGMTFGLISGMGTEEAMQRMINLQQQTKFMTEGLSENATEQQRINQVRNNSIKILDQLNTVENRSAATMEQITFVMNQFASQADLTGESIAAMAAMSATLIEAGEEQGKGGRALRMIYARLGADTNGARSAIEQLGISVVDTETGAMRPFSDVLEDLSAKYQTMSGVEQQSLAQSVAGNRHYTRLIKLLENVDRVRELEREGLEALFPAMDEVERRRETELFQLEQSEAKLKNVKAEIGDELLPIMTDLNEATIILGESFLFLNSLPVIGGAIHGFGKLAMGANAFLGPTANMLMALFNMSIALKTQTAIAKSQQQVTLAGTAHLKNRFDMLVRNTMELQVYNSALTNLKQTEARLNKDRIVHSIKDRDQLNRYMTRTEATTKARLNLEMQLEKNLQQQKRINITTSKSNQLQARAIELTEQITLAKKREGTMQLRAAKAQVDINRQEAKANEKAVADMTAQSTMLNRYSAGLAGAGSMLMIFGKNQNAVNIGLALNTTAMGLQIFKMTQKTRARFKEMLTEINATHSTIANTTAMQVNTAGKNLNIFSTVQLTIANKLLTAGFKASVAASMAFTATLGVFGAALLLAGAAYKSLTKDQDEFLVGYQGLIDFAEAHKLSDAMGMSDINAAIEEQKGIIKSFEDGSTEATKSMVDDAKNLKATLEAAREVEIVSDIDSRALAQEFMDARAVATSRGDFQNKKLRRAALEEEHEDVNDFLVRNSINSMEEYDKISPQILANNGQDAEQIAGNTADVISGTIEELDKFNNKREELFAGFSQGNLTGDLIRQVNQQGVENLITNTEVVMTNVFNGMTIPEVADQIIEEIESRANLAGFNLAG